MDEIPQTAGAAHDEREQILDRAMARHHNSGDALIEILHTAQQLYGYLPAPLLKKIARRLMLPPSRVLGVATFYHLFRLEPLRKHSAVVCLGTACYEAGGTELLEGLRQHPGSGDWSVASGRCVGSCGLAPIVICDGRAMARVTADKLEARLREDHDRGSTGTDAGH